MPESNKIGPQIEKSGLNLTKNRRVGEFKVCKYVYHTNYKSFIFLIVVLVQIVDFTTLTVGKYILLSTNTNSKIDCYPKISRSEVPDA